MKKNIRQNKFDKELLERVPKLAESFKPAAREAEGCSLAPPPTGGEEEALAGGSQSRGEKRSPGGPETRATGAASLTFRCVLLDRCCAKY